MPEGISMNTKNTTNVNRHSSSILHKLWDSRQAYLYLSPLFLGLIIFCYYPPVSGLYHSLFDWDSIGKAKFIGLDNFKELFKDKVFLDSISVMFKLLIPRLIIGITVPLIVAEMVFAVKNSRLKYWYRVLILLPMVAPGVVSALIWKYIYDPNNGLATAIVRTMGMIGPNEVIDWLGNPKMVILSIILMGFPWIGGTSVLIYMSGLMGISTEVIECSVLDGASTLVRIIKIDLPLLMGQIRYFLIFGIIGGLQDYGVQIVLTKGGPGYSTYVPGYHMYMTAFNSGRMGYASAIGTVLFIAIFILTLTSYRFFKLKD